MVDKMHFNTAMIVGDKKEQIERQPSVYSYYAIMFVDPSGKLMQARTKSPCSVVRLFESAELSPIKRQASQKAPIHDAHRKLAMPKVTSSIDS